MSIKMEEMSRKCFRNYQNPIELFKDLTDGNINPKEVLKDQINFKSDLGEIKKGNKKLKSEDQISVIGKVFWFKRKKYWFFRDDSFFLSEAKYKARYGRDLKILTANHMFQRLPIALAQVKAVNTSGNLLKEIRQIIYCPYWAK